MFVAWPVARLSSIPTPELRLGRYKRRKGDKVGVHQPEQLLSMIIISKDYYYLRIIYISKRERRWAQ